MYFKTVILLVSIRFISLPKVIKKMKSTPPPPPPPPKKKKKNFFLGKSLYFENFLPCIEKRRNGFEDRIYPNHFQKQKRKNENQTSRLGVESRFVKKGVLPQNAKTMSYD